MAVRQYDDGGEMMPFSIHGPERSSQSPSAEHLANQLSLSDPSIESLAMNDTLEKKTSETPEAMDLSKGNAVVDDSGDSVSKNHENLEANKSFSLLGIKYRTDDTGKIYSVEGRLLANITYVLDGFNYHTDENGERYLTEDEKRQIKEESGWSDEIIDNISSMAEYEIYKSAGLVEAEIDGKKCLIRNDIDWDQKDASGMTNRERVNAKPPDGPKVPINKNGEKVELHHIGQHQDSPFAELTQTEHRSKSTYSILHDSTKEESEIDRQAFNRERDSYWQSRAQEDT